LVTQIVAMQIQVKAWQLARTAPTHDWKGGADSLQLLQEQWKRNLHVAQRPGRSL
jgi:hypothetical protein